MDCERIVPFQRIDELEYFYTSDSVKNDKVIEVVDVKEKKKFSEEVQGQWALEQIEAVLDILRVRAFVIPKDKGGHDFPVINSRERYFDAHVESKRRTLENIGDAQDAREAYIDVLRQRMERAKGRRETAFINLKSKEEDEGDEKDKLEIDGENKVGIDEVNEEFAKAYSKWNKEQQAQSDDMLRQETIVEGCRKQANRQHDEDADATNRLLSSLFQLKKILQDLIKKFPFLEDIIRQKRSDGIDPYDDNDMRSCYGNLLDRYRQSDEMGILTTIMSGMAEKQGSKPMDAFMLSVEDWHQTMIRLGVQSISMSDLAAIITLKGMNESHRIEFLQQENALALTLDTLDHEDDNMADDGSSSMMSVKKERKSLLVRVKRFIQQDKNKKLINQRLSGGSGISNSSSLATSRREAEERLREAQSVFMTALDKSGVCRPFAATGICRFGKNCRYKHEETILTKKQNASASAAPGDRIRGECYSWRDYGTCARGDTCMFSHGSKAKEHVVAVKEKPADVKKAPQSEKQNSKVTNTLFSVDDEEDSWGNGKEVISCILSSSQDEKVMSINDRHSADKLGWDTMASIHVASGKSELKDLTALRSMWKDTNVYITQDNHRIN